MADKHPQRLRSDYAVAPGRTVVEMLKEKGMSQAGLARRMGRPLKTVNEIIKGKAAITPDTALQLERVLGLSATSWIRLEAGYQEDRARLWDLRRLSDSVGWLKEFPISEMRSMGIIASKQPEHVVGELLRFFGVASRDGWERQWSHMSPMWRLSPSFEATRGALAVWLRLGELTAGEIQTGPFDRGAFRATLDKIRSLTTETPRYFVSRVRDFCAPLGVAVCFVPELPGARVSGAARWLGPQKALIQISWRHGFDDQVWFSFYHEAGHVYLHGRKEEFLDDSPIPAEINAREAEANAFARSILIPDGELSSFITDGDLSPTAIAAFAERIGISPGLVVGRLQHDGRLAWDQGNRLKQKLRWQFP